MSLLDDLNDYKLETSYQRDPEYTIHTSYRADRARGIGKVAVIEKWVRDQKLLGVSTFGSMHKSHIARLKVDYNKEIIALTKFSRSKFSQSQLFVEFFGWFEDDDNMFLAMEYFELGTLNIHMTETLLEQDARSIALQLLEGLKIMHKEGFTHRDLKPENIFIAQKSPACADSIEFIKSILVPFPTHRPTAESVNIRDDQTQSTKGALLPYREDQILSIPDQASGVPAQTTQARKLPALSSNKFPTPAIPILTPTTQVPTSVRLAKLMPSEAPSNFHANESERFVGSDTELSNLKANSKFGRPPLPSGEHRSKPRNLPPVSKDLPAGWKQRKAKDGKLYYVNSKTKKISSKFPKSS
ncbi:hypothetical protein WAI453_007133 [Rhynchosporium graminicola]